ncbi:MAG: TIGR00159 family protein, partial [Verrucomicrobia bacterium]|nr:TIGR00159 family protein [Verrucomicrobiota bacterium]
VSEETGGISICENGVLMRNLSEKIFREKLAEIFFSSTPSHEPEPSQQLDRKDPLAASGDRDLVSR